MKYLVVLLFVLTGCSPWSFLEKDGWESNEGYDFTKNKYFENSYYLSSDSLIDWKSLSTNSDDFYWFGSSIFPNQILFYEKGEVFVHSWRDINEWIDSFSSSNRTEGGYYFVNNDTVIVQTMMAGGRVSNHYYPVVRTLLHEGDQLTLIEIKVKNFETLEWNYISNLNIAFRKKDLPNFPKREIWKVRTDWENQRGIFFRKEFFIWN